jgi:hypothetical protein
MIANIAMCVWLYWKTPLLQQWQVWGWHTRFINLLVILSVAMMIYFIVLRLSGLKWRDFLNQTEIME